MLGWACNPVAFSHPCSCKQLLTHSPIGNPNKFTGSSSWSWWHLCFGLLSVSYLGWGDVCPGLPRRHGTQQGWVEIDWHTKMIDTICSVSFILYPSLSIHWARIICLEGTVLNHNSCRQEWTVPIYNFTTLLVRVCYFYYYYYYYYHYLRQHLLCSCNWLESYCVMQTGLKTWKSSSLRPLECWH